MNSSSEPGATNAGWPEVVAATNSVRPCALPFVTQIRLPSALRDLVGHRDGGVWLAVNGAREKRDRAPWHQFLHESHPAPPAFRGALPYVKAQINFLKIAMEREGDPENPRPQKEKPDDADVADAFEFVEFHARRHERREQLAFDRIVQHQELTPLRAQENFLHALLPNEQRR